MNKHRTANSKNHKTVNRHLFPRWEKYPSSILFISTYQYIYVTSKKQWQKNVFFKLIKYEEESFVLKITKSIH